MKPFLITVLFIAAVTSCRGEGVEVVVTNVPACRMPKEAHDAQSNGTPQMLGNWGSFLTNAMQVTIRYYDKHWAPDDARARQRLDSHLRSDLIEVYNRITWAQGEDIPTVEGTIRYRNGQEGRFMMWGTVGCFQDCDLHWLFLAMKLADK